MSCFCPTSNEIYDKTFLKRSDIVSVVPSPSTIPPTTPFTTSPPTTSSATPPAPSTILSAPFTPTTYRAPTTTAAAKPTARGPIGHSDIRWLILVIFSVLSGTGTVFAVVISLIMSKKKIKNLITDGFSPPISKKRYLSTPCINLFFPLNHELLLVVITPTLPRILHRG